MKNEILSKRGFILILVIVTVVIFISLVWLIATSERWSFLRLPDPSTTGVVSRVGKNCTYPITYWTEHPELFPPELIIGDKVYRADEISELLSRGNQDPQAQLLAQMIGAFLNILSGAEQGMIHTIIFQAYGWLVNHPTVNQVPESELESSARLLTVLEAYNLGLAGVEACQDASMYIIKETATHTLTPTVFSSSTPSQTITSTPSVTTLPTNEPTYPIWTVVVPSATRAPTTEAPEEPLPTATLMPPPPATNTPNPPTEEPAPTLTLPPQLTLPPPP